MPSGTLETESCPRQRLSPSPPPSWINVGSSLSPRRSQFPLKNESYPISWDKDLSLLVYPRNFWAILSSSRNLLEAPYPRKEEADAEKKCRISLRALSPKAQWQLLSSEAHWKHFKSSLWFPKTGFYPDLISTFQFSQVGNLYNCSVTFPGFQQKESQFSIAVVDWILLQRKYLPAG